MCSCKSRQEVDQLNYKLNYPGHMPAWLSCLPEPRYLGGVQHLDRVLPLGPARARGVLVLRLPYPSAIPMAGPGREQLEIRIVQARQRIPKKFLSLFIAKSYPSGPHLAANMIIMCG